MNLLLYFPSRTEQLSMIRGGVNADICAVGKVIFYYLNDFRGNCLIKKTKLSRLCRKLVDTKNMVMRKKDSVFITEVWRKTELLLTVIAAPSTGQRVFKSVT